MASFDLSDVERRVKAMTPDEARELYVQEIFDWTDSFNENLGGSIESEEGKIVFEKLTDLWISYANLEIGLKQWKKAVQVFDDAVQDAIVANNSRIYSAYADFCNSRSKQSNALKAYVKGLKAGLKGEQYDKIWIDFANFMNSTSPQKLSFDELFKAISEQVDVPLQQPSAAAAEAISKGSTPVAEIETPDHTQNTFSESGPIVKEESMTLQRPPEPPLPPVALVSETQTADVISMNIAPTLSFKKPSRFSDDAPIELVNIDDMTGFKYPDDCRLYLHRPPSLFSSPETEPMTSGLDALSVDDLNRLESFFKVQGLDPSLQKDPYSFYERVLDLLEGMWYSQALKERHFDIWFSELIRKHTAEENDLQGTHSGLESYRILLDQLRRKNALQLELMNVIVNKILLSMLKEQQKLLQDIKFPYFENILTVHSLTELEGPNFSKEFETISKQKMILSAALSLRLKSRVSVLSKSPTPNQMQDGKKRKKTRRRLSIEDGGVDSVENSPVSDHSNVPGGDGGNMKRRRLEPTIIPSMDLSKYGPAPNLAPPLQSNLSKNATITPPPSLDLSKYGPAKSAPGPVVAAVSTPTVVIKSAPVDPRLASSEPVHSAAGNSLDSIDPASVPLLQQLAKMLKKKKAVTVSPSNEAT